MRLKIILEHAQRLVETTEEDRALISLSAAIYKKVLQYATTGSDDLINIGAVGSLFDTPIPALNDINIDIQGGEQYAERAGFTNAGNISDMESLAFWDGPSNTIVLNSQYLGRDRMQTTITHELRHALDNVKSHSFPGNAKRYFTPRNKQHRKNDPFSTAQYRAQPAEVNARFTEVLDKLTQVIPKRYATTEVSQLRPRIVHDLKQLLVKYEIADLFPEGTASPDYKRLLKRAYDFIKKEMAHFENNSGTTKRAIGNW
jgi:hypothetical protein